MIQGPNSLASWPLNQINPQQSPQPGGQPQGMGATPLQQPGMAAQGLYQRTPSSPMAPGGAALPYPSAAQSPRQPGMPQQPGMPSVRPSNFLQVPIPLLETAYWGTLAPGEKGCF